MGEAARRPPWAGGCRALAQLKRFDWLLIGLAVLSCALGLVSIAGASGTSLGDPAVAYVVKRQMLSFAIGGVAFLIFSLSDYHFWASWWRVIYGGAILLLMAVMVIGHHSLGAQRWIRVGPFDLQPSELSKLAMVIALAAILSSRAGKMRSYRDLVLPAVAIAFPVLLVLLQPDLGTSLVFLVILGGMAFAAGFPGHKLLLVGVLGLGLAVGLVWAHLRWPHYVPLPIHAYQLARLTAFVNPEAYARTSGYQILQSEMAVGSGRLFGSGLFSGGVGGQLAYMPEATTDFIFTSIADTMGFVGGVAVIVVLGLVVWRVLSCMALAPDTTGALLAAGVACMLGFETLLNVGVTLGLMPVTGVPLPFTSYGGSSAMVSLASIGLVQSVYSRRKRARF